MNMTRLVRSTVVVLTTLVILLLIWQFSFAIVLFLLSLAVAAALRPLILSMTGRNMPKRLALAFVYSLLIAAILSSFLLLGPPLLAEVQTAIDDFIANYDRAKVDWPERGTLFQQTVAEQLPPSTDLYEVLTTEEGLPALAGVFGFAQNFFSSLGSIALVIILSLYWSADQFRFERLALSLLPEAYHPKALHVWRSVEAGVGAYLRSELIQSVLAGLLLWLGYSVLGIRYPILLALWGAIVRLIPWFGALVAVLLPLIIGIGVFSTVGILATLYTIWILLALKFVIEPRFFPRYKYSSLLIVLFVIALAQAFGFTGVILAPPLAVAVQILFQHLYPFPDATVQTEVMQEISEIRDRLIGLRKRLQKSSQRKSLRLIDRLHNLVRRITDYVEEY